MSFQTSLVFDYFDSLQNVIIKGDNVCKITNTKIIPIPDKDILDESMNYLGGGKGSGRAGRGPRGHLTVEKTLYSTLDIKWLDYRGKKLYLFGEGKTEEAARRHNLPLLAQMPIDPELTKLVDEGRIEEMKSEALETAANVLASR